MLWKTRVTNTCRTYNSINNSAQQGESVHKKNSLSQRMLHRVTQLFWSLNWAVQQSLERTNCLWHIPSHNSLIPRMNESSKCKHCQGRTTIVTAIMLTCIVLIILTARTMSMDISLRCLGRRCIRIITIITIWRIITITMWIHVKTTNIWVSTQQSITLMPSTTTISATVLIISITLTMRINLKVWILLPTTATVLLIWIQWITTTFRTT